MMQKRERSATIDGVPLRWSECGRGRPVVLIHGLGDTRRTWGGLMPRLARRYRVLAPDLPAHGPAIDGLEPHTVAWNARVIDRWLGQLRLGSVDLVGHSYGGGVAQWMLLENRRRVRRLALVCSGGLGREVTAWLRLASIPGVLESIGGGVVALGSQVANAVSDAPMIDSAVIGRVMDFLEHHRDPHQRLVFHRTVRDVIDLRGQRRCFFEHASQIDPLPPMRLFWGDRDGVVPVEHGLRTRDALEHCELVSFTGAGHMLQHERPRDLAVALRAFLDEPRMSNALLREVEEAA